MNEITLDELQKAFPNISQMKLVLTQWIVNKWITSKTLEQLECNKKWIKQCFNRPTDHELAMNTLNIVLKGFGVEPIRLENAYVNRYWDDCIGTYINMGDTYITTIVFDTMNHSYHLTSWGDFYEHAENNIDNYS